jgi:chorismate--pyruvate lyase
MHRFAARRIARVLEGPHPWDVSLGRRRDYNIHELFGSRELYAETSTRHHTVRATPGTPASRPERWHDFNQLFHRRAPQSLLPWLLAEGSLTRLLIKASAGDFRVQRIAQGWGRPTLSEARLLGLPPGQRALIREVVLWGRGEPWVYGRSILPASTLSGDLRRLRRLQNSSLGALLFSYPQLRRAPFQLALVAGNTLPGPAHGEEPLWGRRSRFELQQRTLIVSEVFLPAFQRRLPLPPT